MKALSWMSSAPVAVPGKMVELPQKDIEQKEPGIS